MDFKKVVAVATGVLTPARIAAVLMIAFGVWGLMYGNFSFYSSHATQWRGIDVSLKDSVTIYIPMWASIGAIVIGGLLMLGRQKTDR